MQLTKSSIMQNVQQHTKNCFNLPDRTLSPFPAVENQWSQDGSFAVSAAAGFFVAVLRGWAIVS